MSRSPVEGSNAPELACAEPSMEPSIGRDQASLQHDMGCPVSTVPMEGSIVLLKTASQNTARMTTLPSHHANTPDTHFIPYHPRNSARAAGSPASRRLSTTTGSVTNNPAPNASAIFGCSRQSRRAVRGWFCGAATSTGGSGNCRAIHTAAHQPRRRQASARPRPSSPLRYRTETLAGNGN